MIVLKQDFVDISNLPAPRSSQVGGTGAGTLSTRENHCLWSRTSYSFANEQLEEREEMGSPIFSLRIFDQNQIAIFEQLQIVDARIFKQFHVLSAASNQICSEEFQWHLAACRW